MISLMVRALPCILLLLLPCGHLAQEAPKLPQQPRVLTVCEAMENRIALNGKVVAVVGLLGGSDEGIGLREPSCKRKTVVEGLEVKPTIWMEYSTDSALPLPEDLHVEEALLRAKLASAKKKASSKEASQEEKWAIVFGRFETRERVQIVAWGDGSKHIYGFGHLNSALAQIVYRSGFRVFPETNR